jgi:hypothetical protein
MRIAIALSLLVCACGHKDAAGTGSAVGSATAPVAAPATCPAGNVVKDGACIVVVTPEKVLAVQTQKSRLDDLATVLDKVDTLSAPIELLDGLRQTPQWKSIAATSSKFAIVEQVVGVLDQGVKQLRVFRGSLGEASQRLGDLGGELDKMLKEPGTALQLADVRAKVSAEVRGAIEPLALQVQATITKAIAPIEAQLGDTADMVIGACAMAKLSGGGDNLKQLCAQAKDVFGKATAFMVDIKAKPATLFDEVSKQLESQLDQLVDTETKAAIGLAQQKINSLLLLGSAAAVAPPAGAAGAAGSAGSAGLAGASAPTGSAAP